MSRQSACLFQLPAALRPLRAVVAAEDYPGIRTLWAGATLRRTADPVFGIEAVILHFAQTSGTEQAVAQMQAGRASWHWIIPAPGEAQHGRFIWSAAPEARAARHVPNRLHHPRIAGGRGQLNHVSLGVLIAGAEGKPGASPSVWQLEVLAGLIRHLWSRYPRLSTIACRSEIDPDAAPPTVDWPALREAVAMRPADDLPFHVAAATPLALLDRSGRPEPALRAD